MPSATRPCDLDSDAHGDLGGGQDQIDGNADPGAARGGLCPLRGTVIRIFGVFREIRELHGAARAIERAEVAWSACAAYVPRLTGPLTHRRLASPPQLNGA